MYSPDEWEIISEVSSVACITALSLIFGRKLASIDGPVLYIRTLLLSLYTITWAFNLISCMLISTNNGNSISCILALLNCTFLYTSTKVILCLYFIEKIYTMSITKQPRFRSPLYLISIGLMLPYVGLIVLQIIHRVAIVGETAPFYCYLGVTLAGSVPILCYHNLVLCFLLLIFAKYAFFPTSEQQTTLHSATLHLSARYNGMAALVTLLSTTANGLMMIILQGNQRGLVWLSVSTLDVSIVACIIHWVSSHPAELYLYEKSLQPHHGDKSIKLEIKQHQEVVILTEFSTHV
ncbi:hypothetical protein BDF14DRAFT_1875768 [Spinellus fusiger]|nr:hypothetical protein BDF14DRAFT_1875768 [Spinellus fusiger]